MTSVFVCFCARMKFDDMRACARVCVCMCVYVDKSASFRI